MRLMAEKHANVWWIGYCGGFLRLGACNRMPYSVACMFKKASLYHHDGTRKYLNTSERRSFQELTGEMTHLRNRALCLVLLYAGCRITEAISLHARHIDFAERALVFRTLKQHGLERHRAVPVPKELLAVLAHYIEQGEIGKDDLLFPIHRTTGWRIVKQEMAKAGVTGVKASPKGLRHTSATTSVLKDVPLTMVQKWLGHARLENTKIYLDIIGEEERALAKRVWNA